jgi:hypothetical protein
MKPISYAREVKEAAKVSQCGMLTMSLVFADGHRIDVQRAARSIDEINFLKWALAAIEAEEVRDTINLKALEAAVMAASPTT